MNAQFCHSGLISPEGMPGYACGQVDDGASSCALTSCTLTATKLKRRARAENAFFVMMFAKSWPRTNGRKEKGKEKESMCRPHIVRQTLHYMHLKIEKAYCGRWGGAVGRSASAAWGHADTIVIHQSRRQGRESLERRQREELVGKHLEATKDRVVAQQEGSPCRLFCEFRRKLTGREQGALLAGEDSEGEVCIPATPRILITSLST